MGRVRLVKAFETREVTTKSGRKLYVVESMVNYIVDENREYVVSLLSEFPLIEGSEYEVSLNGLNIRVKKAKDVPFPGIPVPGIPNPNKTKL